ncbi:MAG: hypothetical protein IJU15_07695 [Synergistaceae bacterium]|nr:hypothetical protein [Synergistaceae bacterium]
MQMQKRRFLWLLVFTISFSCLSTAHAENVNIGTNFAEALADSKAVLKSGSKNVSVTLSDNDGNISLSVNASDITLIDLFEVDLSKITLEDVTSFDKVFTGLEYLTMKLTNTNLDSAVKFPSCQKLKELDLSGSTGLRILDITDLTELTSLKAGDSGLRALNLGTVTVSGGSMFGMLGGGNSDSDTVSKPLAALTDLDLSDCPNLDRVGYLISSDGGGMMPGLGGGSLSAGYKTHVFMPIVKKLEDDGSNDDSDSGGLGDLLTNTGPSYNADDTSYPKLESGGGSMQLFGGNSLSGYSGEDVNLLPAIKTLNFSNSGTDDTDCIHEINTNELKTLEAADFSGMTELNILSLPAGNTLKDLNLTGDTALYSLSLTDTKGFLLPEGFETLTGLESFDMMNREDLTSIDLSTMTNLVKLDFTNSALESLDVTENTALEKLNVGGNKISVLDLSQHKNLKTLNVRLNRLVKLDLSRNLNLYLGTDWKAQLSPQIRLMNTLRSKIFDFIKELGYTRSEMSNILAESVKGDGDTPVDVVLSEGKVHFESAPYVIAYNYSSGLYEGSDPVYLSVQLKWPDDAPESTDKYGNENGNHGRTDGLTGSSGGCNAGWGITAFAFILLAALFIHKRPATCL